MPYVVVCEFGSKTSAESFVRGINHESEFSTRCVGMYRIPTQFCSCASNTREKMKSWSRGRKYGWFIHADCGKPSPAWVRGLGRRMSTVLGRNLMPLEEVPEEWRDPEDEPISRHHLIAQQAVKYQLPSSKRDDT